MGKARLLSGLAAAASVGCAILIACGGGGDDSDNNNGDDSIGGDGGTDGTTTTTGDGATQTDAAPFAFPTPIKHIIVIVKENHTYGNFFGEFDGGPGDFPFGIATLHDGTTIQRPHCPSAGIDRDFPHDHASAVRAFNDGGMNGLDLNNNTVQDTAASPKDYEAYCMFGPVNQLGFYWSLRQSFATANHYYANMLAPSFPGHLASTIGKSPAFSNPGCPADAESCESTTDSWGCTDAPGTVADTYNIDTCEILPPAFPCYDTPTWMDLFPSNLTWAAYGKRRLGSSTTNPQSLDDAGAPLILSSFNAVKKHSTVAERIAHFHEETQIVPQIVFTNRDAGGPTLPGLLPDLPNVMFWTDASSNSEHPPGSGSPPVTPVCGEQDDYDIVNAVMSGPHWNDTVILITMDDWGGFYDQVAPPVERCANGAFFNPGFRLPLLIVSAYAKPAFILTDHTEQASIPRLIEEVFGLPLTSTRDPQNRDGKAGSLLPAFDFTSPPRAPITLTRPVNAACTNPTAPAIDAGP
ncbi:MAG: alkaline phosphatase family protein [Polyangiaceae bacterium]